MLFCVLFDTVYGRTGKQNRGQQRCERESLIIITINEQTRISLSLLGDRITR